jgi:hypothetical protein
MEFKQIELVLENCEVITVERKYLGSIYMSNFTEIISRHRKSLIQSTVVNEFAIEIHRSLDETVAKQGLFDDYNPIQRLNKFNDITQLEITYEDGTKKHFYTHWHDDDEYNNRYQKNKLNQFGDLYIVISENNDIDQYFNEYFINDEDNWDEYKE